MLHSIYDRQRVCNFMDAVFSIALTVLILDVTAPIFKDPSAVSLADLTSVRLAELIGYVVSFFVIAMFWRANVRNIAHAKEIDGGLLKRLIWQLFFVVLLPFSTALYVLNFNSDACFQWYAINVALISVANNQVVKYLSKSPVQDGTLTRKYRTYYLLRGRTVVIIWLIAAAIAPWTPLIVSRGLFVSIFIIDRLVDQHWRRRLF